jgi:Xaa-Pro aminopeptidase
MNKRIVNCLKRLKKANCKALLVTAPANVAYLTGTNEIDGYILLAIDDRPLLFTNFIYAVQANNLADFQPIMAGLGESMFSLLTKHIAKFKYKRVGFNPKHLSYLEHKTISTYLVNKSLEFTPLPGIIEDLRATKDREELANIKKSINITKEAFTYAREILSENMSEKTLAIEIDKFLRLKGDNELAFDTIVAAGANASSPHHRPGDQAIGSENVLIDLGAKYYGYCADLTRVLICSKMPLLSRKIKDTLLKAQDLAIQKIRPGAKISDVDKAARGYIEKRGWGKNFGHGLGHGVGLQVHEEPFLGPRNNGVLKKGMVITVEPAIYIEKKMGFRIEDMVLVGSQKAEVLSGNGYW